MDYKKHLKQVNDKVDQIRSGYRTLLNKMQDNDAGQINLMKHNMQKVASTIGKVGQDLQSSAENIFDASQMVNAATDIKIFIEHNKSSNLVVAKERFQSYDERQQVPSSGRTSSFKGLVEEKFAANFVIDENYMSSTVTEVVERPISARYDA